MEFIEVPEGTFLMGASEKDPHALYLETPQVEVNLSSFKIADHPVSNLDWKNFIDASGYEGIGDNYLLHWQKYGEKGEIKEDDPICFICMEDVKTFCDFYKYAIPTEAQWEYAASVIGKDSFLGLWEFCQDAWDEYALLQIKKQERVLTDPCIQVPMIERVPLLNKSQAAYLEYISFFGVARGCGKEWLRFNNSFRYPLKPAIYRRTQVPLIARHHCYGFRPISLPNEMLDKVVASWEEMLFDE